jgi:phage terminase large subunit-like protein
VINALTNNPIIGYYNKIESGEIRVNRKVRRQYQELVEDIQKWDRGESEWEYSQAHADHVIGFIEKYCKHSKGKWAGKPVILDLWQKAFIAAAYGFIHYDTRERKYREALLFVPRKNGKSLLASCLGLYHFVSDGECGAEVYSVATKKDQARITFNEARLMVKKSPALSKRIKVRQTDLWHDDSESLFKALASDSNSLDGLNSSCVLADEIHAWKDMNLYDVMKDSMTARQNPMMLVISTMGTVRGSAFDTLYELAEKQIQGFDGVGDYENERMLCVIYELDDPKTNIHKPETWVMCNPMAGIVKDMEQIYEKYNRAKQKPILFPNLLCKDFNVRSSSSVAWLQFDQYNNENTYDIKEKKFRYFIGGSDLSKNNDWTSACALFKLLGDDTFYVDNMYWITRSMYESLLDKLPVETWCNLGLLRICEGNSIDQKDVVAWFLELQQELDIYMFKTGYDNWSSSLFTSNMAETFGEVSIVPVIQGKKTLSAPMHYLGKALENKKVNYNNNPITKIHIANTVVDVDKNGNIQPIKGTDNSKKIDGLACMLNAFVIYLDHAEEFESMI